MALYTVYLKYGSSIARLIALQTPSLSSTIFLLYFILFYALCKCCLSFGASKEKSVYPYTSKNEDILIYYMSENTKKERIAANLASLSSLVLILFGLLQDKYEFFHELPNLIVLLICVVCTITSIWAASNLISNNKHVKVSLFQVSATSALAAVILVLNFRNLS